MQAVKRLSVSFANTVSGMLRVDNDFETRSRTSITSILEDLVQLRKNFLNKDGELMVNKVLLFFKSQITKSFLVFFFNFFNFLW